MTAYALDDWGLGALVYLPLLPWLLTAFVQHAAMFTVSAVQRLFS